MRKQRELTQKSKNPYWVYEIDRILNHNKKKKEAREKNSSPHEIQHGKDQNSS